MLPGSRLSIFGEGKDIQRPSSETGDSAAFTIDFALKPAEDATDLLMGTWYVEADTEELREVVVDALRRQLAARGADVSTRAVWSGIYIDDRRDPQTSP